MPSIGPLELVVILLIVLVIFGPKRLPGLGRQLGSGMREFKDSLTGKGSRDEEDDDDRDGVRREAIEARPAERPAADPRPAEPEVVSGEARPQDQPASRAERS